MMESLADGAGKGSSASIGYGDSAVEPIRIVANGQDEGQQLLFGLFRRPKAIDLNAARREMHARRKRLQLLLEDGRRGFDQHARLLFGAAVKFVEKHMEALAPLLFKRCGIAGG